jgi:hypothetical protein
MRKVCCEEKEFSIRGKVVRTATVSAEGYEFVSDPRAVTRELRQSTRVDILTFTQPLTDPQGNYGYHREPEGLAVLRLSDYETWWKKQVNDKTRNMVRKSGKKGVEIKVVPFTDELVRGIEAIHNEHPMRQGRPFKHYGKPFEQVKRDHESYLNRSDFIAALFEGELIGFIKLVHSEGWSNIMQILSKIAHRDKAPTNGLIAKAIEICAARGVTQLQYGSWNTRQGIEDFKVHHAFERVEVSRYFVPLSPLGSLTLKMKMHRGLAELLPIGLTRWLMDFRAKLYTYRYRHHSIKGAVA